MADLQSEFSGLIELLEKVHNSCEKKRKEIELSCQNYRELLAPWPDEVRPTKQEEKPEQEGEIPKEEGGSGDIPEREIQELKLLDNVLAKAQKVRQRHEREVKENDHYEKEINNESTLESTTAHKGQRHEEVRVKVKRPESGRQNQVSSASKEQKSTGKDQAASISQAKLNKLVNMTGLSRNPSTSVKVPPRSRGPTGGVKKSYKLQAPYKTEPERPKVSSRLQRPSSRSTSASSRSSQVSQNKSLSTRPKVTSTCRNNGKVPDSKKRIVAQPPSQLKDTASVFSESKHSTTEHLSEMERELDRNPANQQSADIAKWLEDVKLSGIGEGDQAEVAAEHKEEEETEKKRFLLKDDASKLVIPGKWKKLCTQNLRIRRKVQEIQLKQEQSAHKQHFVTRVQSRLTNNGGCSGVEIPYKLMDIQRKKERLLQMVEGADIGNLSLDSPWQDICNAKVLLEFVHSQFREIISDVSQIENSSKDTVRNSGKRQLSALTSAAEMNDTPTCTTTDSYRWLLDELVPKTFAEMSCSPTTPELMVYSDLKDLKKMVTLQHEAQILQLQIHIQKLVGDKILPLLQNMDRKDPLFLTLYRTVYSILTTGGERFPTLVKDF